MNIIDGVGNLSDSKIIHALRKSQYNYGRSICNCYIHTYIKKELTLMDITCKRCLKILKLDVNFIKEEEFTI